MSSRRAPSGRTTKTEGYVRLTSPRLLSSLFLSAILSNLRSHKRYMSSPHLPPMQEPNDLSFSAGEIVEIIDETNADWWTGKCRGKQGLFPSNHVEKIDSRAAAGASPSPPSMPMMPVPSAPSYYSPPPPGPPQQYGMPANPEKAALYQSHYAPPPPAPVVVQSPAPVQVQQQAPEQPPKKNKFGKLGSTMATSAAGGVGFGAGEWSWPRRRGVS